MSQQECLVVLDIHPSLEESLVDTLLMFESEQGFSGFPINSHHHQNEGLSVAEQVAGRQKKVRFQMYVPEQDVATLLAHIRQKYSGAGIDYRVLPVIESGRI